MGVGKSRIDDSERQTAPEDFFVIIHIERQLYYWIILFISIIAIVGNLLVIRSVLIRKYKHLQKTCMISLAISDMLTVITFCINYLDLLGKRLNLVWSSGEFLCWYTPVGQVLFNLASSVALLVIALDRYHNVIYALDKKWDPKLWICILGALVLWGFCFAVSYPMINFYFYVPLRLPSGEDVNMCTGTSTTRHGIAYYYVIIDVLIFGPLVSTFFWFYYKIAILIWRHRKPPSLRTDTKIEEFENTSYTKGSSETSGGSNVKSRVIKKKRNVQMERKIRTFKIVIVLIVAFILCRMPYWLFWLLKLLTSVRGGDAVWRTIFIMTSLNLLNCALNPFLYTYLNQAIYVCRKINDCFWSTCCCCFSNAEFEDYERGTPIYEGVLGQVATTDQWMAARNRPEVNPGFEKFPQVPHFPKYTSVNRY